MSDFYSCHRCGEPLDGDYQLCWDCYDDEVEAALEEIRQEAEFERECGE